MRVAILGAGAMGTMLAHGFCTGGHTVAVLDLPDRVAQLKATGKVFLTDAEGHESSANPALITADFAELGPQDFIFLATKSQSLPGMANDIARLAGSDAAIVTIQNGIPWWYLQGLAHRFNAKRINCLDPDGALESALKPEQLIGCVAYPAATLDANGHAHHVEGLRFPVGEVIGDVQDRTQQLVELFESAGYKSRTINDIRSEIWLKAWGALSINPISALTRATMEDICTFEDTRLLIEQMMQEAQQVAEAFGASFRHTIEKRIEGAKAVGAHRTSMLQDVDNGRPLELDGLMLAVLELADIAGIKTPCIRNIYACTALLNQSLLSNLDQSK